MNQGNEISRRSAIGMIMLAPLAARAYAGQMFKGRDTRPNFLFLLPDQFRFDWLSGNPDGAASRAARSLHQYHRDCTLRQRFSKRSSLLSVAYGADTAELAGDRSR